MKFERSPQGGVETAAIERRLGGGGGRDPRGERLAAGRYRGKRLRAAGGGRRRCDVEGDVHSGLIEPDGTCVLLFPEVRIARRKCRVPEPRPSRRPPFGDGGAIASLARFNLRAAGSLHMDGGSILVCL